MITQCNEDIKTISVWHMQFCSIHLNRHQYKGSNFFESYVIGLDLLANVRIATH